MQNNKSATYTLMIVWGFWGFVAAANGILIPLFKEKFHLSQWQSQLVDFVFYVAYFVGSILYLLLSAAMKGDILNKIGYKNGIIYGLIISALGTLLFIPAANNESFNLLLLALFIVGLGFSLQQTSTQPFMVALGPPEEGAQRINLGGAVNNFGATIGPVLISYAIFGAVGKAAAGVDISIEAIKTPYLILGAAFLLVAVFFHFSNLPRITNDEKVEIGTGVLKYPQLVLGMAAIFVYVGVEVSIGSNLGEYLRKTVNMGTSEIAPYVSLFWGSMMIGRWTASVPNFSLSKQMKSILMILMPFIAFAVVLLVNKLNGSDITVLYPYVICIAGVIASFFYSADKPVKTLLTFTGMGMVAMLIGLLTTGKVALFSFIAGGLFCSVLWPCIIALAIAGLGKYTNQGMSYLIMMILGGAIIPVVQGLIADKIGIHESYALCLVCFAFLFWFGIRVQTVLRNQGIDFDKDIAVKAGH
jgi:MFS transporter, FHS family, L-fucose permease